MEIISRVPLRILILGLHLWVASLSFAHCDARRSMHLIIRGGARHLRGGGGGEGSIKIMKRIQLTNPLVAIVAQLEDTSNTKPYSVGSPFTLPPYDSLAPIPLPENTPPFCLFPPFTPQPPSTSTPTPIPNFPPAPPNGGGGVIFPPPSSSTFPPIQLPPESPSGSGSVPISPNPPETFPSPSTPTPTPTIVPSPPAESVPPSPPTFVPSPTVPALSPPYYFEPTPPSSVLPSPTIPALSPPYYSFEPTPPSSVVPSLSPPSIFVPSPTVFQPPVVFPPPTVPPHPRTGPKTALWCVAKPSVPDPIVQEAMNYACGSGADCDSILPNGSCFQPNTLFAHASYAFNSYWQRTKVAGGTCDFGGSAILVTVDPSYDGCHFVYY